MELGAVNELGEGLGLSLEEHAVLEVLFAQTALEERLASIRLWGRVGGTRHDYLIAAARRAGHGGPGYAFFYW